MNPAFERVKADALAASKTGDFAKVVIIWDSALDLPDLSEQDRAEALLYRCEAKDRAKDRDGAIDDCGEVLSLRGAADDQKAEALHQRARFKAKSGGYKEGVADLSAILGLADASSDRRAKALLLRGELWAQLFKTDREVADYEAVLAMKDVPADRHAAALFGRALARHTPDPRAAEADYRKILAMDGVSEKWRRLAEEHLAKLR